VEFNALKESGEFRKNSSDLIPLALPRIVVATSEEDPENTAI